MPDNSLIVAAQWLLAAPVAAMLGWFALETGLGLVPLRRPALAGPVPATAILVPAHDEAGGIAATVTALRAAAPGARVLVVADNCSDQTAALARGAGAEVAERSDPARRGKGYALAFGRERLAADPPAVVIVIDADCRLAPGAADLLAREVAAGAGPVQAANLLVGQAGDPPQVAISNFAMMVKNLFRARGMLRLGGSGLLFGTGMAFPWTLFARLPLATGDATEDISLGLDLAREGVRVRLADHARVTSPPAALAQSRGQRSRWEHGFLRSMGRQGLPLLARGLSSGSRRLAAIGAHMLVPPLALLVMAGAAALALVGLAVPLGGSPWPAMLLAAGFAAASLALLAAWAAGGRAVLSGRQLLAIPAYVLWKLPIYLGFFSRRRQVTWNRTDRS